MPRLISGSSGMSCRRSGSPTVGRFYVVDGQGRLIAHSDISLVLSNSDFSHLAQVRTALAASSGSQSSQEPFEGIHGERVLAAHAVIAPLGWFVFVELPVAEAYAPIYASILRSGCTACRCAGACRPGGLHACAAHGRSHRSAANDSARGSAAEIWTNASLSRRATSSRPGRAVQQHGRAARAILCNAGTQGPGTHARA